MQARRSLFPTSDGPLTAAPSRTPRIRINWMTQPRLSVFALVIFCTAVFALTFVLNAARRSNAFTSSTNADLIDQQLQHAASVALGDRRGTVIVMDPQTGRVRAVVNPEIAFEESLPPGSTIKPFTALAALRSGVIDEDSRTLCHETYSHEQFHTICSHPRDLPPLNPTDAIAYSCNYYFGKVGERLSETDFDSTLEEFGFGKATGVNAARESRGVLRRNDWQSENAMGGGDHLRVTPIQLINAYSTLVNGGHRFTPHVSAAGDFVSESRGSVAIENEPRQIILNGMRGAVRYGTAETANFYSLPIYVFGKTGTATEINGYRSQGWFVGFASALTEDAADSSASAPENVKLAVLVFLARAHGSEAAELARPIFEAYARISETKTPEHFGTSQGASSTQTGVDATNERRLSASPRAASVVRVHLVRENITRTMPLEEYVRGVVAAEGSMEREPEALKALAVASRTYALKNLQRHAHDGYDFCTTTHCQRFHAAGGDGDAAPEVIAAVNATRGEVLHDAGEQLVDSYFSASCGGATANLGKLWGGVTPPYLRGVADEYCEHEPHHVWTDVISQPRVLQALQTDQRTRVERLVNLNVLRTDPSGRAELIAIEGDRRVTVKGWDFKIIVGRALGWNLLKSSRFEISRAGSNFIFRGSGFGHGLGLCQEGAHVMAARGAGYRQILAKYFPSTRIAEASNSQASADIMWLGDPSSNNETPRIAPSSAASFLNAAIAHSSYQSSSVSRRTLSSENFRINYPGTVDQDEIQALMSFLESSRASLIKRAAAANVSVKLPNIEIYFGETTGDFVGRTAMPIWAAAATRGNQIELQPLGTLKRRGILETTLLHEIVHTMIESVSRGGAPRWLSEGFALHLAGEGRLLARYQPRPEMNVQEIEKRLGYSRSMVSADEMRMVYAAAYGQVRSLIKNQGEASVWRRVAR
jgi:stage II sporulation protein D